MMNEYFRYYKPNLFIGFIVFLGIILYLGNNYISDHFGISLTILSTITVLLIFIDKYLWKKKPFSWLFWIKDFSGRYEGEISYIHPESKNNDIKQCAIEIKQTGSKIKLTSYFDNDKSEKTYSKSLICSIIKDEFDAFNIIFTYQNKGNQNLGFPQHFGTNVLQFKSNENIKFIEGIYYTNRVPQTKGDIKVILKSKILKGEFCIRSS